MPSNKNKTPSTSKLKKKAISYCRRKNFYSNRQARRNKKKNEKLVLYLQYLQYLVTMVGRLRKFFKLNSPRTANGQKYLIFVKVGNVNSQNKYVYI